MPDNSNLWSQALSDPEQAAMQPETFANPLVKKKVENLVNVLKIPGQVMQAQQPVTTEDLIQPSRDMAMQFGMLGVPMAKPGTAGIFGGRLAHTAKMDNLEAAEAMANQGVPRNEVLLDTGWHQNPADMEWRFEIPDNKSRFTTMPYHEGDRAVGIASALFHHPDFYKAYPEFQNLKIDLTNDARFPKGNGSWDQNTNTLGILAPNAQVARSVALHELQHAVGDKEGFSPGSNPDYYAHLIEEGMKKQGKDFDYFTTEKAAHDLYHKTAGEVESRNVQARADLSPVERKLQYPWNTQDVGYHDQFHWDPKAGLTPVPARAQQLMAQALKNK